jgi:hypothetical protein
MERCHEQILFGHYKGKNLGKPEYQGIACEGRQRKTKKRSGGSTRVMHSKHDQPTNRIFRKFEMLSLRLLMCGLQLAPKWPGVPHSSCVSGQANPVQ